MLVGFKTNNYVSENGFGQKAREDRKYQDLRGIMRNVILQLSAVLTLAFSISAQENQPVLFDEFGKMSNHDLLWRISGLAVEIYKIPNSKALVRISGGNKDYFGSPYIRGSLIKSGWENNRNNPADKLLIQFCNVNEGTIYTRFFIVRENDKVETCDENFIAPKQTVLFERVSYTYYFEYLETSEAAFDSIEDTYLEYEGVPPPQYSKFALNIIKRLLKDSPESKVYIIAYLQTNFEQDEYGKFLTKKTSSLDKKSYAAKMFRAARKELIKNGLSPSQMVMINGGYVNGNGRRLELWFVPKGGAIPKPKPDYIPKKAK